MANEKIHEYTRVVTVPDDDARFDMDDWDGAAFISTQITYANLKAALGAGNLGNTDLSQTDLVRYFTLQNDEEGCLLIFRNNSESNSLTINGQCDVYNHGLNSIATNLLYGLNAARGITGDNNTVNGVNALSGATAVDNNSAFGYNAGRYVSGSSTENDLGAESTYLGAETYPLRNDDVNCIIIGNGAVGKGSNTVVIGNASILENYFNGDVYATSLAGVGDRNVIADANGMLKIGTSLSLISHYASFVTFPSIGSTEVIYIADDTDYMYIWDAGNSQYVRVGGDSIYLQNGQIDTDVRFVRLNQNAPIAHLTFEDATGTSILRVDGLRDVFIDKLKAPTGLIYTVGIDDDGRLTSFQTPSNYGSTWQNITISADGQTVLTLPQAVLGDVLVYYDGNIQFDYTKTNNTTITMDEGQPAGKVIKIFG